jgi:hypothetical protein
MCNYRYSIHKQDRDCPHALSVDARWVYLQFRDLDLCTSGTICTVEHAREVGMQAGQATRTLLRFSVA